MTLHPVILLYAPILVISSVIGAVVYMKNRRLGLSAADAWDDAEGHLLVGLIFGVVLYPLFALMTFVVLVCFFVWLVSDFLSDLVAYLGRI